MYTYIVDDQARPPLYQPPKKEIIEDGTKTPTVQPSQKRRKSSATRISSAKHSAKVHCCLNLLHKLLFVVEKVMFEVS